MLFKSWQIPFTYAWIMHRLIPHQSTTLLDLGAGKGAALALAHPPVRLRATAVEIHSAYFPALRRSGLYHTYIRADIMRLPSHLKRSRFDIVFLSQVIEHLPRTSALRLLTQWESLARRRIIITTPRGYLAYDHPQEPVVNNKYQQHKSGWLERDFRRLGYVVHGQGLGLIYGPNGWGRRWGYLGIFSLISYLFSPLIYFFPRYSAYLIAHKDIP